MLFDRIVVPNKNIYAILKTKETVVVSKRLNEIDWM